MFPNKNTREKDKMTDAFNTHTSHNIPIIREDDLTRCRQEKMTLDDRQCFQQKSPEQTYEMTPTPGASNEAVPDNGKMPIDVFKTQPLAQPPRKMEDTADLHFVPSLETEESRAQGLE